jgi:hypothetical protein
MTRNIAKAAMSRCLTWLYQVCLELKEEFAFPKQGPNDMLDKKIRNRNGNLKLYLKSFGVYLQPRGTMLREADNGFGRFRSGAVWGFGRGGEEVLRRLLYILNVDLDEKV